MSEFRGILERFQQLKPLATPGRWRACCPVHGDEHPSLGLWINDNGWLCAKCHAKGCSRQAIAEAVGTRLSEWGPARGVEGRTMSESRLVKTYDYCTGDGKMVYQVCRFEPKDFRVRRPDPDLVGEYIWNLAGVHPLLYRLPDIVAKPDHPVIIVEGEKDADTLAELGLVATTNNGGAGKWQRQLGAFLDGRRIAIVHDLDEPGERHAYDVAAKLMWWGADIESLRIVTLPNLNGRIKDVTDWLAAIGGDRTKRRTELTSVIREAAEWKCIGVGKRAN